MGPFDANELLNTYFKKKALYDLGENVGARFFGDDMNDLKRQDVILGMAVKRSQLGLPLNDDIYEDVLNTESKGFLERTGPQAMFGNIGSRAVETSYSTSGSFIDSLRGKTGIGFPSSPGGRSATTSLLGGLKRGSIPGRLLGIFDTIRRRA